MELAVRKAKLDATLQRLLSLPDSRAEDITVAPTNYNGITMLNSEESDVYDLNVISNIEALLLMELPQHNRGIVRELAKNPHSNH